MRFQLLALSLAVLCFGACRTPDGPRHPIPQQTLSEASPQGSSKVIFFNTSNHFLYFESGMIRIKLNGDQLPTLNLDRYIQVFVEPGTYVLKLEHFDLFMWKGTHSLTVDSLEVFVEVYNSLFSTKFRRVDALPENFRERFKAGRHPSNW
jgi:hypothetical protein